MKPPRSFAFVGSRRSLISIAAAAGMLGIASRARVRPSPAIRSSDFPSLASAIFQWSKVGGVLVIDKDYVETAPITMACLPDLHYRLTTDGVRNLAYAGPQFHWFLCIYSEGRNPVSLEGQLTIDGRGNCNMPLFVRFENVAGSERRAFEVIGLTAMNARMKRGASPIDGSATNVYGATAMMFMGGFDRLLLRNVKAINVTREAGAGHRGSQGCVGIGVVGQLGATRSARHITIEDFEVQRVDSEDPPGSPDRGDMDGVLVFQSAERTGTRPIVQRGTISEAGGRAIKIYAPGGGGITRNINIHRSIPGSTTVTTEVAHQHGDGTIENIVVHYSGRANAYPTVVIGMSSGSVRGPGFPFRSGVVRNVRINDTTGRAKSTLVSLFFNLEDQTSRQYVLSNIIDSGITETLFRPGGLGTYHDAIVEIDRVKVYLTGGLMATEDPSPRLQVRVRNFVNRNLKRLPVRIFYDGRAAPAGHGSALIADEAARKFLD